MILQIIEKKTFDMDEDQTALLYAFFMIFSLEVPSHYRDTDQIFRETVAAQVCTTYTACMVQVVYVAVRTTFLWL